MESTPRRPPLRIPEGLYYDSSFVMPARRAEILAWLGTLRPIWEQRYSEHMPPPPGKSQRWLLRPIYWLGNWQFACLNYYHPPKGIHNRCVQAEAFPPPVQELVNKIEKLTRQKFHPRDIPKGWHLNTCLINMYGSRLENGKWEDTARVGEHKDFEPGPVASISFGERAMFQFVASQGRDSRNTVVFQQWLEDSSLQLFGSPKWKDRLFHRVQRVDTKRKEEFALQVENFRVRRINFTFRYVPDEHIIPYAALPEPLGKDVQGYMEQLAENSEFFRDALKKARWVKHSN